MALPFQNPVSQCMPGFGSPSFYGAVTQTATGTGTDTLVIAAATTTPSSGGTPFNLSGGPPPSSGKWHFRVVNGTTTATLKLSVQVTDGTNVWEVGSYDDQTAGTLSTGYLDITGEFKTDVSITAVNFVAVVGGTVTSFPMDAEVSLV